MNNKPADTRSYATKHHSEPGKGDDIPCVRCAGNVSPDTTRRTHPDSEHADATLWSWKGLQ